MATDPLSLVDKQYLVPMKGGKLHPTYPGVLEAAMRHGLIRLSVELVQAPLPENGELAICAATAVFPGPEGVQRTFQEVGDCGPKNCAPGIAVHAVRMAATRAKGRALRDALGIGIALAEEMTDDAGDEEATPRGARAAANGGANSASPQQSRPAQAARQPMAQGEEARVVADMADPAVCTVCSASLMDREISGCVQAGWPLMCYTHAREYKAGLKLIAERETAGAKS